MRILVVDDDPSGTKILGGLLRSAGFECIEADNIYEAYRLIKVKAPNLLVLKELQHSGSGYELLEAVKKREDTKSIKVIMLSETKCDANIIRAFEMGVTDYLTEPFSPEEALARIRARTVSMEGEKDDSECRVGELVLNPKSRRAELGSIDLGLTPTEFRLLRFFMEHPEQAFSRSEILTLVWGRSSHIRDRIVDVHIRRLRKQLQDSNPAYSNLIQTVRGKGYRFSPRDLRAVEFGSAKKDA